MFDELKEVKHIKEIKGSKCLQEKAEAYLEL